MSTSGEIVVDAVTKRFGDAAAVDDLSLVINGGEFFTMLGPSGCGKTTTLRMIAGFESPDEGAIRLDGADITDLTPAKRNMNMVFQSYGLFPHMTVRENIGFGPKVKRVSRSDSAARVVEAIHTVQLEGLEERRPAQLSGGQQQRVALARALVNGPAALLLDEPLGALDLKLRREMQLELKGLQQRTGTTFVYVTHDQEEAMTMSDRIAVLSNGKIEQVASPKELYQRPASRFVAEFIGTSNVMERGSQLVTVRPEWIRLSPGRGGEPGPGCEIVEGTLTDVVYLGSITQLLVRLTTGEMLAVHRLNDQVDTDDPRRGDPVTLWWSGEHRYVIEERA